MRNGAGGKGVKVIGDGFVWEMPLGKDLALELAGLLAEEVLVEVLAELAEL